MTDITPQQAEALARFLLTLRPDWSLQYTHAAVNNMRLISSDVERITRAAVRGALARRNGTWSLVKPDPLAMTGEHWKAQADLSPEPPRPTKCDGCHDWHTLGAECTPRRLTKADSHIAELRAVHAEARQHLCPHGVPPVYCADHNGKNPDHTPPAMGAPA